MMSWIRGTTQRVYIGITRERSSITVTDARLTTLETEHQAFRCHLIDVHLKLEDGENHSRWNDLRLWGIPEATMNKILGKPPTAKVELDRVH